MCCHEQVHIHIHLTILVTLVSNAVMDEIVGMLCVSNISLAQGSVIFWLLSIMFWITLPSQWVGLEYVVVGGGSPLRGFLFIALICCKNLLVNIRDAAKSQIDVCTSCPAIPQYWHTVLMLWRDIVERFWEVGIDCLFLYSIFSVRYYVVPNRSVLYRSLGSNIIINNPLSFLDIYF